jgi:hypothetical protein
MSNDPDDFDEGDDALAAGWTELNLTPVVPPAELRRRILAGLDGVERFRPVFQGLRRFVDLDADAVNELLRKVDDPTTWNTGLPGMEDIHYFHFTPGAGADGAEAGFMRIGRGATFPRHRHLGPERLFVVDGVMHERGRAYGPGSVLESAAGTAHEYVAGPGRDLIVVSLHHGFELV